MTPKGEIFENHFRKYLTGGTLIHVLWPSLVKIGRREVAEKSSAFTNRKVWLNWARLSLTFRPHWANRAQNFLNVVVPSPAYVYRSLSGSVGICWSCSQKPDFLDPRSDYKISWKPAMQLSAYKRSATVKCKPAQINTKHPGTSSLTWRPRALKCCLSSLCSFWS